LLEIPVGTESSFIQFMTSDDNDNVWFVEQQGNKIGTVKITEIPINISEIQKSNDFRLKYTEKSIQDKRRLNSLINS
jgi:copper transport protein